MSVETFMKIIGGSVTEEEAELLLERAKKKAVNHYFWKSDDVPTEDELAVFYDRYEFEIYDVGKTIREEDSKGGLKEFTELGVTRVWGNTGTKSISDSLSAIPTKTYVW